MEDLKLLTDLFMVMFALSGLLVVGLSIPMILGKVKPNWWYGFRTPKTLSDERIWYKANAYAGKLLLVIGLSWVVGAVVLRYIPAIGGSFELYNWAYLLLVIIGLILLLILSLRYLSSL